MFHKKIKLNKQKYLDSDSSFLFRQELPNVYRLSKSYLINILYHEYFITGYKQHLGAYCDSVEKQNRIKPVLRRDMV